MAQTKTLYSFTIDGNTAYGIHIGTNSENHYIGTPGSIAKDDILLYTGSSTPQIAVVTAVDTKSKSARSRFNGAKIVTQAI